MKTSATALIITLFCALCLHAQESQPATVLLDVPSAESITINSTNHGTMITIRNVDPSGNNFYYQTGFVDSASSGSSTMVLFSNIKNVLVEETPLNIKVTFSDGHDNVQTYVFDFPDPTNRSVKSYIGKKSSDFGFTIARKGKTEWSVISGGFGIGWNAPLNARPGFNPQFFTSYDLTWHMLIGVRMQRNFNSLTFGLGLDWQNYVTHSGRYFHKNPGGRISLEPYLDGTHDKRSRIKIFSLQVPVMYGHRFGHKHHLGFSVGPVLNFNTHSSIRTSYKLNGSEYTILTNHAGQRPVTVDAMATFNYRLIGLYFRYSPMKKLRTTADLDFSALSAGIMFGF